jgi:Mrp family chromosome partitioning ATPase
LLDYVETLVSRGETVLIVDCEASGAFTESVGLTGAAGLSDFLTGQYPEGRPPVWQSNWEGTLIMPVGSDPLRIPALLAKPHSGDALASLGVEYGNVVINAPSILTSGEMRDLTPQIDGVILVTPSERSEGLTNAAVRQVEEYGGRVVGWVEENAAQPA